MLTKISIWNDIIVIYSLKSTEIPFMRQLIFSILFLCTIALNAQKMSNQEYIERFKDIAMEEMRTHKVPASITLAQGILESGSGNSRLATQGNNHFGIKCKKNWTGGTIIEDDDEKNECFRAYLSAHESYKDHSLFLRSNQRYAFLFDLSILDYKGWAEGLRQAGYATNQRYPQLLISIIERLNLAQYDTLVFYGKDSPSFAPVKQLAANIQMVDNGVPLTVAREGQTVRSISEENNMRDWQIYKYNDLPKGSRIEPGMVVYLKPKRNKASVPEHMVNEGESMWEISQKYGIKLKKLYKKNRMEPGTEPKPGETVSMRRRTRVMPDTGKVVPQSLKAPEPVKTNAHTGFSETQSPSHYPEKPNRPLPNGFKSHIVAQGEGLFAIARNYGVSVQQLIEWNALSSEQINVGDVLHYLPQQIVRSIHIVKSGDTLFSIARQYEVSVEQLKSWNNLSSNEIRVGQEIVIEKRQ